MRFLFRSAVELAGAIDDLRTCKRRAWRLSGAVVASRCAFEARISSIVRERWKISPSMLAVLLSLTRLAIIEMRFYILN